MCRFARALSSIKPIGRLGIRSAHTKPDEAFRKLPPFVAPAEKLMTGPGPSNVYARVLAAMSMPTAGHLHPSYVNIMNETQDLMRYALQTANKETYALPATGCGAMEASIANVVEDGDTVLVAHNGYWGERVTDIALRYTSKVVHTKTPYGTVFDIGQLAEAVKEHKPQVLFCVHGESSAGTMQPLEGLKEICEENNTLLIADTVCTLAGAPLFVDNWGIDVVYSGSQKCLGTPPGVSPISFSPRAMEKITTRKTPIRGAYWDANKWLSKYWNGEARVYHHTGPANNVYALHEGLRIVVENGLENMWEKHSNAAQLLYACLQEQGFELAVSNPEARLPTVTLVKVPEGVDAKAVQTYMFNELGVEVSGGLGDLAGKVWRIGLMGTNTRLDVPPRVVNALRHAVDKVGRA